MVPSGVVKPTKMTMTKKTTRVEKIVLSRKNPPVVTTSQKVRSVTTKKKNVTTKKKNVTPKKSPSTLAKKTKMKTKMKKIVTFSSF